MNENIEAKLWRWACNEHETFHKICYTCNTIIENSQYQIVYAYVSCVYSEHCFLCNKIIGNHDVIIYLPNLPKDIQRDITYRSTSDICHEAQNRFNS